jgi:hypothetical protein
MYATMSPASTGSRVENCFDKMIGRNGRRPSTFSSPNITPKVCSATPLQWTMMPLSSILCGHTTLKPWINVNRLDAYVTGLWVLVSFRSSTKHMPIVLTRQISRLFYAISAAENLLVFGADVSNTFAKAPHQNRGSTSDQIWLSMTGGSITKATLLFHLGMLSPH